MIRKLFLFATFLLTMTFASAQAVGEWTFFTLYTGNVDAIVETPQSVYYTSGNRLFSYDKTSNETYAYTTKNKLNDTNVTYIRYNPASKYLFIAYDTGNIDLLYDNGRIINLSDIKDATLTYDKGINTATFANGRIYIGTKFGMVIYDDKKHEVVESGIYGRSVQTVLPVNNTILVLHIYQNERAIYYAPLNGYHNTFDKFTFFAGLNGPWMEYTDSGVLFKDLNSQNQLGHYRFSFDANGRPGWGGFTHEDIEPTDTPLMVSDGYFVRSKNQLVKVDTEGNVVETINLPEKLQSQKIATNSGAKSIWGADADGVANYSIDNGTLTLLSDKFKPEGIVTPEVFDIYIDYTGAVWTNQLGVTHYRANRDDDFYYLPQTTTRIKNGHPEDMSIFENASCRDAATARVQHEQGNTKMYGGTTGLDVDPENPNRYFQGNNIEGLYIIEDNKEIYKFHSGNSPLIGLWGARVQDVKFDAEGNLWVAVFTENVNRAPLWMLPKSVLRSKDYSEIVTSDWKESVLKGLAIGQKDLRMLHCKHQPVIITTDGSDWPSIGVLKTNGTLGNLSDDTYFEYYKATDQDGKTWNPTHVTCAVEDHDGRIWVGSANGGIVQLPAYADLNESSRITRIKVPRNDGTNYADYLCETDVISGISVDNSNRKWIATETSGVYLVSETGDEILEHFTTDNSPLPSNMVVSVACDPNSNMVYFGLLSGLVAYNSTSSPAAEDYSEVYAYPNPVRPDYTGYITITGLMDNSLVKITDNAQNVVFQTMSEGGMAIWDGFDSNHNRVKSGVYYVFASQAGDTNSKGAVAKIMIIR